MSAALWIQYVVVALTVLLSVWVVLDKQAPGTARALRTGLALVLLREGRSGWLHWVGRRLAPTPTAIDGKDCGACNGCGDGSTSG